MKKIRVDPISCCSVLLKLKFNDLVISTATGFFISFESKKYLITNLHVVSGRDPDSGECMDKKYAAIPNRISFGFHMNGRLDNYVEIDHILHDSDGKPLWLEHPLSNIDVVAMPIAESEIIDVSVLDMSLMNTDIVEAPAMSVSIVGFPFGLSTGKNWPIWKTGHIASDPDLDYDGKPAFLIDATTRAGMSGSPVILRLSGGYQNAIGISVLCGLATKFLGVYSGRINEFSEIGMVWRPFIIEEIIRQRLIFNEVTGRARVKQDDICPCNRGLIFSQCCGKFT